MAIPGVIPVVAARRREQAENGSNAGTDTQNGYLRGDKSANGYNGGDIMNDDGNAETTATTVTGSPGGKG
jgi:hypothetical protein